MNRSAVTAAPIQTSCHAIYTRGRILYISANSAVTTARLRSTLTSCSSHSSSPKTPPHQRAERRERGADRQRDQHHEADADHQAERQHAARDHAPQTLGLLHRGRLPDAVEVALQLGEHGGGADHQQRRRRRSSRRRLRSVSLALRDEPLDRLRAVGADQPADLRVQLTARGLAAEQEAGDGDDDHAAAARSRTPCSTRSRRPCSGRSRRPCRDRLPEHRPQRSMATTPRASCKSPSNAQPTVRANLHGAPGKDYLRNGAPCEAVERLLVAAGVARRCAGRGVNARRRPLRGPRG